MPQKKPSNDVFGDVVAHDLDLLLYSHSCERPFKCNECGYCCTLSSFVARHKLTHSSNHPFKCDQCKCKCDEKSDCFSGEKKSPANSSQACTISKGCFTWQCPIQVLHSVILLFREMLRCLPSNSLDPFWRSRSIEILLWKIQKLRHPALHRLPAPRCPFLSK